MTDTTNGTVTNEGTAIVTPKDVVIPNMGMTDIYAKAHEIWETGEAPKAEEAKAEEAKAEEIVEAPKTDEVKAEEKPVEAVKPEDDRFAKVEKTVQALAEQIAKLTELKAEPPKKEEDPDSDENFEASLKKMLDEEYGDSDVARKLAERMARTEREYKTQINSLKSELEARRAAEESERGNKIFIEMCEKAHVPVSDRDKVGSMLVAAIKGGADANEAFEFLTKGYNAPAAEPKGTKVSTSKTTVSAKNSRDIPTSNRAGAEPEGKKPMGLNQIKTWARGLLENKG